MQMMTSGDISLENLECPACAGTGGHVIARWRDWAHAAPSRSGGLMRLEAAQHCGYAQKKPDFLQCATCRSVALHPTPTPDEIAAFYQNYHATAGFTRKAEKKVARAWRRIALMRHRAPGRNFLEVGANIGVGAEAARRLGFNATAVEPDREATAAGEKLFPGVRHVAGMVEDLPRGPAFDFIYMAEIVEHVPDPLRFMTAIASRMTPGAVLFATTPDIGHWRQPKNFLDRKPVIPPEHIVLFTRPGLRALFERAGLAKIRFRPHPKPGIRVTAIKPPAGNQSISEKVGTGFSIRNATKQKL